MGDPRLQIQEGIHGQFVIVGFPHHIGAKRDCVRVGQDHGPDCLRRFLPKIGPLKNVEYNKDISQIVVTDYGNIHTENDNNLEALIEKLRSKVQLVKQKLNVPIVIGGTKDCSFACLDENVNVISIINEPDLDMVYDGNKCSINSSMKNYIQNGGKLRGATYFGLGKLSKESLQFIVQNDFRYILMNDIRSTNVPLSQDLSEPNTQAGAKFQGLLKSLPKDGQIHLSISLEAVDVRKLNKQSAYCPGVSRPSVQGLTSEEIIEIAYLSGLDGRVVSLDITEYNPTIEDYRSGFLLGNIIYYHMMGKGTPIS